MRARLRTYVFLIVDNGVGDISVLMIKGIQRKRNVYQAKLESWTIDSFYILVISRKKIGPSSAPTRIKQSET